MTRYSLLLLSAIAATCAVGFVASSFVAQAMDVLLEHPAAAWVVVLGMVVAGLVWASARAYRQLDRDFPHSYDKRRD